jgi:hypothetical protein
MRSWAVGRNSKDRQDLKRLMPFQIVHDSYYLCWGPESTQRALAASGTGVI